MSIKRQVTILFNREEKEHPLYKLYENAKHDQLNHLIENGKSLWIAYMFREVQNKDFLIVFSDSERALKRFVKDYWLNDRLNKLK